METENKRCVELYDTPKKINVERFFEIQETGDLNLLKVAECDVDPEVLSDVWLDLLDYYYSNTNELSYGNFKRKLRNVVTLEKELLACAIGLRIMDFDEERGQQALAELGLKGDKKSIESAIRRKETKLEFARNKIDQTGKRERVQFFQMVAGVEQRLGRQLNLTDVSLERWIAYIKHIKDLNTQTNGANKKRRYNSAEGD